VKDFPDHARVSYAKVAEYQSRGLIHFHAVIRLDGPEGPHDPAPNWGTSELIEHAIRAGVQTAKVTRELTIDGVTSTHMFVWGQQADIRAIRPADAADLEDDSGQISDRALAGYIAKYATKGTSTSEVPDRPIRSELDIANLHVHEHHRRMITAAWDLGSNPGLEFLRKWAHMLGFRGHFLTKSQRYSITFSTIRGERRTFQHLAALETAGIDPGTVLVINHWKHTGNGYRTDEERDIAGAIYERKRNHRKEKLEKEHTP
jgi:hypothetical protein